MEYTTDREKINAIIEIIDDPTDYLSVPDIYMVNIPMSPLKKSDLIVKALEEYIEILHERFLKIVAVLDEKLGE